MTGSIHIILGCMYSGKTTYLIAEYQKYKMKGIPCICINHSLDPTHEKQNTLRSHDGIEIPTITVTNFDEIDNETITNARVILINEAQFFKNLKEFAVNCAENMNKIVIVAGLDGDYKRDKFGEILDLIPYAEAGHVVKLPALCEFCNECVDASFSLRVTEEQDQISVHSKYVPVCRKHYKEN